MFGKRLHTKILSLVLLALFFAIGSWGVSDRVAAVPVDAYESLKIFTDVVGIIQENYTEEVETKEMVYGAVKGMLRGLDPHSSFLTPEEYKEMQVDTKGSFGGIGIEIGMRDGILTVISPIEDTPAFRAGVLAGDKIVKVEDTPTKNLSLMQAVRLMRGPKGKALNIWIMREGFKKPKKFTIIRDIIKIKSVKYELLEEGYAYVRLTQFQEKTGGDLDKALKEMGSMKGEVKGLVLDLRNNPGGLLHQAVSVSDKFLSEGLIVYTKGRVEGQSMDFSAKKEGTHPTYPIIVIVNSGSASASEIVAGALQDHRRAVILGAKTFGKGSVQTVIPLSDGSAVRLTTSKYYTPSGVSIQAKGITPDIEVGAPITAHLREKDLEGHLMGDGEEDEEEPGEEKDNGGAAEETGDDLGSPYVKKDGVRDFQVERALDYLKSWHIFRQTLEEGGEGAGPDEMKEAI